MVIDLNRSEKFYDNREFSKKVKYIKHPVDLYGSTEKVNKSMEYLVDLIDNQMTQMPEKLIVIHW